MTRTYSTDQSKAIDKLAKVKCGALFMEAGTGKTAAARAIVNSTDADYILWVTPYRTQDNLRQELDNCGGLDCDIVGVESIQASDRIYLQYKQRCDAASKAFIVMDESLKIKNAKAKRTKRMIELAKSSAYRLILNGTPLSRNLLDLWSQMQFLSPKILSMDYAQFKDTFCEYVKVTYYSKNMAVSYSKEVIKKYHNVAYLYKLIQPFIFESKLSLSIGKQYIEIKYDLTEEERRDHDKLKDRYLDHEYILLKNNNIFLEITQKMQHNYSLSPAKFSIVDALLVDVPKCKVLIYAKFIETQRQLAKRYPDVAIKSFQKHSYGLNLQQYSVIIFWDKTWDYAQREQIERRIYRTGQDSECIYYDLTANIGLDKLIATNINNKRNLLDVFSEMSIAQVKELI